MAHCQLLLYAFWVPFEVSHVQAAVDTLVSRATVDKFQLNETKCKELLIKFNSKNSTSFDPVVVNGMSIYLVASAKILTGLNISNDLKWNCHIDFIIKKAKNHLYGLSQLKRSGSGHSELVQFFCICINPITEYTWPVFHDGLPVYLSKELECLQKQAMRTFFLFVHSMRPWLNRAWLNVQTAVLNWLTNYLKKVYRTNRINSMNFFQPAAHVPFT